MPHGRPPGEQPRKNQHHDDARSAVSGADYVVTSIRVGNEQGRIFDERIALRHGVLGQETTGPGGFAMALRSIPAILDYAALIQEVSPRPGCSTSPTRRAGDPGPA